MCYVNDLIYNCCLSPKVCIEIFTVFSFSQRVVNVNVAKQTFEFLKKYKNKKINNELSQSYHTLSAP